MVSSTSGLTSVTSTVTALLDHPLFYAICVVIIGLYSPSVCSKNIDTLRQLYNNDLFRISILAIIVVTSLYDIPLALVWTITYLALWICVWNHETQMMLQHKK